MFDDAAGPQGCARHAWSELRNPSNLISVDDSVQTVDPSGADDRGSYEAVGPLSVDRRFQLMSAGGLDHIRCVVRPSPQV